MPSPCCVPYCRGNYKTGPKVSVYSFPREENIKKAWIAAIRRKDFVPTKHSRVCSKHFQDTDFETIRQGYNPTTGVLIQVRLDHKRLVPGAVPSCFPACFSGSETSKKRHMRKKVMQSPGTVVKEVQDHNPIEPTVKIKEEPADDYPNPSTSNDTANEEFILPHADNIWTSDSVVEPQFTLSVASLAYPNEPEPSDGEQLKKRKRTNPSEITTLASAPNNTEVKPRSPVHNFGEISNPNWSKEHGKDQFDAFGEYVAFKLRSLDLVSSTFAQKAIGDIILEAEMGKFLNKTQNTKS